MIEIGFKPSFIRQVKCLEENLRVEVLEKIELFKDRKNHKALKVHKLHGALADCRSFSVNYKTRIVFRYETKNEAVLLAIGDYGIYN